MIVVTMDGSWTCPRLLAMTTYPTTMYNTGRKNVITHLTLELSDVRLIEFVLHSPVPRINRVDSF